MAAPVMAQVYFQLQLAEIVTSPLSSLFRPDWLWGPNPRPPKPYAYGLFPSAHRTAGTSANYNTLLHMMVMLCCMGLQFRCCTQLWV